MTPEQLYAEGKKYVEEHGQIEYGKYEDAPFGIVDGWGTVNGLATFLVVKAGAYGLYAQAINHARTKPYSRTDTVTVDGNQVQCITDLRLGTDGLFPSDSQSFRFFVPEPLQEAQVEEVCEALLCGADFRGEGTESGGWGFSDEYQRCDHCSTILRTSPDSYGWTPNFFQTQDGELLCPACADTEEVLVEYEGERRHLPDFVNREKAGLVELDSYEVGLHPGQNDSPEKVIATLHEQGIEVWLHLLPGQFDTSFTPLVRGKDEEKAHAILEGADVKLPYERKVVTYR